jgi:hypothetical protein
MNSDGWWVGTARGNLKYWVQTLLQGQFIRYKQHRDWTGIETGASNIIIVKYFRMIRWKI